MASDIRFGQPDCKTAFLFARVGLSGADMGACALLPRLIGLGRAAELLFTGRDMTSEEGLAWASTIGLSRMFWQRRTRWPAKAGRRP